MDESRASRTSSQKSHRETKIPLDSAQLWTILLYKETRKLLGASAHAFRAACPVEGVQSPPEGKTGSNQLSFDLLRQSESIGYDTRVFPQWSWRDTDRIHRWLQGARTDELMSFNGSSCEECSPIVTQLRKVRDECFHSWVVTCKIDTAWVPTLIPFDASCPGTRHLRTSLEHIYAHLTPSPVGNSPNGSSLQSSNNTTPSSIKATPSPLGECETSVLSFFLHHYIPFLFPGISDDRAEAAIQSLLECTAMWQTSPTRRNLRALASSMRSGHSTNSEESSASSSRTHQLEHYILGNPKGDVPHSLPFPIVAAILVVLAEPYCFNERDGANFLAQGGSMLLKSIGPSLKAEVDRPRQPHHNTIHPLGANITHTSNLPYSPILPNLLALSDATYGSSASLVSDMSHSRDTAKGAGMRVRVRMSSWSKVNASDLPKNEERLPEIPSRTVQHPIANLNQLQQVQHPLMSVRREPEGTAVIPQPRCPSVSGRRVSVTFVPGGGTGVNYSLSAQGASASNNSNSNSFRVAGMGSPVGASGMRSTITERDQEAYSGWFSEVGKTGGA